MIPAAVCSDAGCQDEHAARATIARCNKGVVHLRMAVDEQGVTFEFEAPKCDIGDRCLEMVRRGDYSGCSFEFYPEGLRGGAHQRAQTVRMKSSSATSFEFLSSHLSAWIPAYKQTSVNAREMDKLTPTEGRKREAEAAEQAKREGRKSKERT